METPNTSGMFTLNLKDLAKGAVTAAFGGFFLPILAAVQTPDFSIVTVDWESLLVLAVNGAILGFAVYVSKNFFTDSKGKVFGKIG